MGQELTGQLKIASAPAVPAIFDTDGASNGGSSPGIVRVTLTAADIAARFDSGNSTVELPGITTDMYVWGAVEVASDLDQNAAFQEIAAWTPGASTADVEASGEGLGFSVTNLSAGAAVTTARVGNVVSTSIKLSWMNDGMAAYAVYNADAAPMTGSATLLIFVS